MISFLRTRRKTWIPLLCVVLLLTSSIIIYLYASSAPYQLIPNGLPFPIEGAFPSFREPYQNEQSSIHIAPYSSEYSFQSNHNYMKLKIINVRVLEMNTKTIYDAPYLIVEAIPEKILYMTSESKFTPNESIHLCIPYFPDDSTLSCMMPKLEKGRSYYISFQSMKPISNPPTQEYVILDALADYTASSTIYSIIPVNDEGNVILSEAMLQDMKSPGERKSYGSISFTIDQSLSSSEFEKLYQSSITHYCVASENNLTSQ